MTDTKTQSLLDGLNSLVFDPDFMLLARKTTYTSVLESLSFKETAKSNVLAWLLDPVEGHLQSDYFLKLFIAAIYQNATPAQLALMPAQANIGIRSLSNISVMTEVTVKGAQDRRIDLLLADISSQTLIVIERKDGSKAHTKQLFAYEKWAEKHYADWDKLYVLSDSSNRDHGKQVPKQFIQLDDQWLTLALSNLIQKDGLPTKLEYAFRDIHDHIFGHWQEQTDPFHTGMENMCKTLAQRHAPTLAQYESFELLVNKDTIALRNLDPAVFFTQVYPRFDLQDESELLLKQICQLVQANYSALAELEEYGEFGVLADKIEKRYPEIWAEVHKGVVHLYSRRHPLPSTEYWPFYLSIHKEDDDNSYSLSVAANKRSPEHAWQVAELFTQAYEMNVRVNWRFKKLVLIESLEQLSLDVGSELLTTLDEFNQQVSALPLLDKE